jgi:hypothetical protein
MPDALGATTEQRAMRNYADRNFTPRLLPAPY